MTSNDNLPVLPYIDDTVSQHIQALKNIINNYKGYTLLHSHGLSTNNILDLNFRVRYLEYALKKDKS